MEKFLEDAQKLYNEGKWEESERLIDEILPRLQIDEEIAEAYRLKGWNRYYLGTKGLSEKREENLQRSKAAFNVALGKTKDRKKRISAANGLPLTLWILGEAEKVAAWTVSDKAIEEFPDEPSVWNTRSILFRWAKDFEVSAKVCEIVYERALAKGDYRTAGNAKQNKADALKELGQIQEARNEYAAAIGLYGQFEEVTGQSAKFHIEGVKKKALAL